MASRRMNTPATSILNLRYRFSSGGDSELCGKYGGGVYVAMSAPLEYLTGKILVKSETLAGYLERLTGRALTIPHIRINVSIRHTPRSRI